MPRALLRGATARWDVTMPPNQTLLPPHHIGCPQDRGRGTAADMSVCLSVCVSLLVCIGRRRGELSTCELFCTRTRCSVTRRVKGAATDQAARGQVRLSISSSSRRANQRPHHIFCLRAAHASIGESTAISPPASHPAARRVGRLFASSGLACGTGSRFAVDTTPHCLSVLPRVSRASRRTPHASPSLTRYQLLGCCCQPREHATSHFSLRLGTYLSCLTCTHSYSPRL